MRTINLWVISSTDVPEKNKTKQNKNKKTNKQKTKQKKTKKNKKKPLSPVPNHLELS